MTFYDIILGVGNALAWPIDYIGEGLFDDS